jgi:sugar lactone lactonase YvrE
MEGKAMKIRKVGVLLTGGLAAACLTAETIPAQQATGAAVRYELIERWKTPASLDTPESVLFDPAEQVLYVSNVAGKPLEKDGRGFISKVSPDGAVQVLHWADGLNAPKGMAIHGGFLFVSDIDELVQIDLKTGKISAVYPASGARFLNDVAADAAGNIYVSDSSAQNSVIYRLTSGKLDIWLKTPEIRDPNGLFVQGNRLLAGDGRPGALHSIDLNTSQITRLASTVSGIDGLQPFSGGYLVSDWAGKTAVITPEGQTVLLMDTTGTGTNSADFEYIASRRLLIIPTFFGNRLIAYEVRPADGRP